MIRGWAMCVAATLLLGCQSGEEPVRGAQRDFPPSQVQQATPPPPREPIEAPTPEPRALQFASVEPTAEGAERDLGEELKAALGTPIDCVRDFSAASPTTIRVSIGGIVRPTGMIIEPIAYASGLSAAALACIRQRAGTVVLQPLDATVSSRAATVIEIKYEPPAIVEDDIVLPEPQLKNVVEAMPKRPHIPLIGEGGPGIPITDPYRGWLHGGNVKQVEGPPPKRVTGPKPRPIEGYEVDQNAQEWD